MATGDPYYCFKHKCWWLDCEYAHRPKSDTMLLNDFTCIDELHYPDGRVIVLPEKHNVLQINAFGVLLGKLASGKDLTAGITRVEVGTGNAAWDAAPPPPTPTATETGLVTPLARVTVSGADFAYLVPNTSTVSGSATRRIQVTVTVAIGVGNGNLREVALYGGAAATGTLGTGDLISVIRHVVIPKPSGTGDFDLVRKISVQFGS